MVRWLPITRHWIIRFWDRNTKFVFALAILHGLLNSRDCSVSQTSDVIQDQAGVIGELL